MPLRPSELADSPTTHETLCTLHAIVCVRDFDSFLRYIVFIRAEFNVKVILIMVISNRFCCATLRMQSKCEHSKLCEGVSQLKSIGKFVLSCNAALFSTMLCVCVMCKVCCELIWFNYKTCASSNFLWIVVRGTISIEQHFWICSDKRAHTTVMWRYLLLSFIRHIQNSAWLGMQSAVFPQAISKVSYGNTQEYVITE